MSQLILEGPGSVLQWVIFSKDMTREAWGWGGCFDIRVVVRVPGFGAGAAHLNVFLFVRLNLSRHYTSPFSSFCNKDCLKNAEPFCCI